MANGVYLLFDTQTESMQADRFLTQQGFQHQMTSTPRQLSDYCGTAIRMEPEVAATAWAVLEEHAEITHRGLFVLEDPIWTGDDELEDIDADNRG